MNRRRGITTDMPEDCCLIEARLIRPGDTVRFRNSRWDYLVEDADTTAIGDVRHRHGNGTASSSYHPGELLWITRRATRAALGGHER